MGEITFSEYASFAPKKKAKPKSKADDTKSKECNVGGKKYRIAKTRNGKEQQCGGAKRARLDPRRVDDLRKMGGTFDAAIGGLKDGRKYQVTPEMLEAANKLGVSQLQLQAGRVPVAAQTELRRKFNQMTIGDSVVKGSPSKADKSKPEPVSEKQVTDLSIKSIDVSRKIRKGEITEDGPEAAAIMQQWTDVAGRVAKGEIDPGISLREFNNLDEDLFESRGFGYNSPLKRQYLESTKAARDLFDIVNRGVDASGSATIPANLATTWERLSAARIRRDELFSNERELKEKLRKERSPDLSRAIHQQSMDELNKKMDELKALRPSTTVESTTLPRRVFGSGQELITSAKDELARLSAERDKQESNFREAMDANEKRRAEITSELERMSKEMDLLMNQRG